MTTRAIEPLEIIVPVDVSRLSKNQRLNYFARARLVKRARAAAVAAWRAAGSPRSPVPILLNMTIRRGRRLDDDNAIGGAACLRDGLCNGQIVPNDSPDWVTVGTLKQETGKQWKGAECVVVTITPRESG